jgi:hypothetical protein
MDDSKRQREEKGIHSLMYSYGIDRDNAVKAREVQNVRAVEMGFGGAVGAFAVYKARPILNDMTMKYAIMRKAWMRFPVPAAIFLTAYHVATMFPNRAIRKLTYTPHVTHDTYTGETDLVGKFRLFDSQQVASADASLHNYAASFSTEALTEPEIMKNLQDAAKKTSANQEVKDSRWRVKRLGPDTNDHYWFYGKIHGLENIAYLSPEQVAACEGSPVKLQMAINELVIPKGQAQTYEQRVSGLKDSLQNYKDEVAKRNITATDRKKLLSMPFYMMKRSEKPEPKKGQSEWGLFKEMYGHAWDADLLTVQDDEEKITEFNYEKFLHADELARWDQDSDEFKEYIKVLNLSTKTRHERIQHNKKQFRELMPMLAQLDNREQRDFIHMCQSESHQGQWLDQLCSNVVEKELAELSEEENYAAKNQYVHNARKLQYMNKKRMPVDERKVKDMLQNQHIFRDKMNEQIGTYQSELDKPQMDHGLLTYVNEAAYGEMRDLIRDVGISAESTPYYSFERIEAFQKN